MAAPTGSHPLLPPITPINEYYWRGGAVGELLIVRCQACGYRIYPEAPICPSCRSSDLRPEAVSGMGTLYSYTIVHHTGHPLVAVPHAVGLIELVEQRDLRLTTNVVGCDHSELFIGMPVQVTFEQSGDVYIPLFEPARGAM